MFVRTHGAIREIPVSVYWNSNRDPLNQGVEQCLRVSLTGAVSSQRVTEEHKGTLSMVSNHA